MSNELVKYQPELNTIPLRKFSPVEMNLFFQLCLECVIRVTKPSALALTS
ncbi:RepB (plasmid) [Levilactobacillus brevis]|nr:RepB [Levilactobacillus brevis]